MLWYPTALGADSPYPQPVPRPALGSAAQVAASEMQPRHGALGRSTVVESLMSSDELPTMISNSPGSTTQTNC